MKLYIAEKPSLGRAIANALPKPLSKGDGFIRAANGDVVSWCIGHLLEQAEPEAYNPEFKKWRHEHLPITPESWKLKPKKSSAKQLKVLREWVKKADQLVHAGDPDREGQLLVDEVIDYLKVKGSKKENIARCLISDLNAPAVKQALQSLRSNQEFIPLSVSALARSRADWLYGINLTRAYTLQGQQVGYKGVLSVGRVQTPILGLVVKRDQEIENFVPHAYYQVWANLKTNEGEAFKALWIPSEHCSKFLDDKGRNLSKPLAENVAARIEGKEGSVSSLERKRIKQNAPLPLNLSQLQIEANKRFGLSAKAVLDICQSLYETHKLITYPRSDCRFLPEGHYTQASDVCRHIQATLQNITLHSLCEGHDDQHIFQTLNLSQKSRAWNDKKVDAHHAIIPTQKTGARLSADEGKIYQLICRFYLAQFLPEHVFYNTLAKVMIEGGLFQAKAKEIEQLGWKQLFQFKNTQKNNDEEELQTLPKLKKGQALLCTHSNIFEKFTTPPKYFTEATLLAAMTGIARYVTDQNLKSILKETDGLGTEATRAGIIELLFNRGFMKREGKTVKATPSGCALIEALPEALTLPDRTAHWESTLNAISERKAQYQQFMGPLESELKELTQQSRSIFPHALKGLGTFSFKKNSKNKAAYTKGKKRGKKSSQAA